MRRRLLVRCGRPGKRGWRQRTRRRMPPLALEEERAEEVLAMGCEYQS